jgi:hypothetical protein
MYKCPGRHIRRSQDRESRKDSKTNTVHYEQQSAVLDHKLEICGTYGLAFRHCLEVIEDVRKNERFAKRKRATTRDTAKEGGGCDAKAFLKLPWRNAHSSKPDYRQKCMLRTPRVATPL